MKNSLRRVSNDQAFSSTAKIRELATISKKKKKKIIQTRRHPLEEPFLSITGKVNDRKDDRNEQKAEKKRQKKAETK